MTYLGNYFKTNRPKDMKGIKTLLSKHEKVDLECKEASFSLPRSVFESYSAFANTNGGIILLGIKENNNSYQIVGVDNPNKLINDFWNAINSNKVSMNILDDSDVYAISEEDKTVIVISVPRADCSYRPVYIDENPYKGTYKRNNQGDYHANQYEIKAMIRDQNPDGNDGMIIDGKGMESIDKETLRGYRQAFLNLNYQHVWNKLDDLPFLEKLGGYHKEEGREGLTLAGLLMFGDGLVIRDKFDNFFMDYRSEIDTNNNLRWNDRITYDGTWENNLYNFFTMVTPKLTSDLPKPFKLVGIQRIDDTPVHKAVREAFVNAIIHADYLMDAGTLKVIKKDNEFLFSNPGVLKVPVEDIYSGGISKPRNPRIQTMLRMVGFGDNVGSGFPTILDVWNQNAWPKPILEERTTLNQVDLTLNMNKPNEFGDVVGTNDTKIGHIDTDFGTENVKIGQIGTDFGTENVKIGQIGTDFLYSKVTKDIEKYFPNNITFKKIDSYANIIIYLYANPNATLSELEESLNIPRRSLLRYISQLKDIGLVKRVEKEKDGYLELLYKVKE